MTFLSVMGRVEFCTQKEARGMVGVGSQFESTVHPIRDVVAVARA